MNPLLSAIISLPHVKPADVTPKCHHLTSVLPFLIIQGACLSLEDRPVLGALAPPTLLLLLLLAP
jgi:hypothetical protein